MANEITILIADDHPLVREGLKQVINKHSHINIIAEASDGKNALELIMSHAPSIAILDVNMPQRTGLQVAKMVNRKKIETRIIFLTMFKEEDMFNEAMDSGALGYVLKENVTE